MRKKLLVLALCITPIIALSQTTLLIENQDNRTIRVKIHFCYVNIRLKPWEVRRIETEAIKFDPYVEIKSRRGKYGSYLLECKDDFPTPKGTYRVSIYWNKRMKSYGTSFFRESN